MPIKRRRFLECALIFPALAMKTSSILAFSESTFRNANPFKRVRPGDAGWPSERKWQQLKGLLSGKLTKLESPLAVCKSSANSNACTEFFKGLKNPFFIGDNPALTQTTGWLDAWRSEPSAYAVAATTTSDVVAAVNFARKNKLRLVVKGGGHSYQGTSNCADSLLIWTREMKKVELHDHFVAQGCEGKQLPQGAATIESGALWLHAYDAVTTKGSRYVQGGGCMTVGVAGLIQSGGFGSFSKYYGLAAAALLQAEIVTADGSVKIVNACQHPDLFWALKGGGGGSFGVVTKLTLRTRELPEYFGAVFTSIQANSDIAYKKLIRKIMEFYREKLFNPQWGEQIRFRTDNIIDVSMLVHGLTKDQAQETWQSFENWVKESPEDYSFEQPLNIIALPAQHLWDPAFLKKYAPDVIESDNQPNAPEGNVYWKSNIEESGQFLYGYHSAWLPQKLLGENNIQKLTDALFASSRFYTVSLHLNKGLAGAPEEEINAAKNTAINPDALDAFTLVIIAGEGEPAFAGISGHEPDVNEGRSEVKSMDKAFAEIKKIAPNAGSYVSESNYFEKDWKQSFWGNNYPRLSAVKKQYDPEGLFFVHHGVGSDEWSDDGFTRLQ